MAALQVAVVVFCRWQRSELQVLSVKNIRPDQPDARRTIRTLLQTFLNILSSIIYLNTAGGIMQPV